MEPKFLFLILILLPTTSTLVLSSLSSSSSATVAQYTTFVTKSCTTATYPAACLKSLLPYASTIKSNHLKLVNIALSTTLKSANSTLATISKIAKRNGLTKWEAAVLKDCIGDIKDSMSEIKDSLKVISGISKSSDKHFAISNAQTWTSAAITDENSCLDGLSDRKTIDPTIKKKIRSSIVSLARVSSNALYLINNLQV